jgi:hypothetical protein
MNTNTRSRWGCGLIVFLSIAGLGVFGCETQEQEEEVNNVVSEGIKAFEQGDLAKLLKFTTRDFVAYPGKLDRKTIARRLYPTFRNQKNVSVLHPDPDIEIDPNEESALVDMPLIVVDRSDLGKQLDDLDNDLKKWISRSEQFAEVQHLELSMVKQGDRWLVRTARFL